MKIIKLENGNVCMTLTEKEDVLKMRLNDEDTLAENHVPEYTRLSDKIEVRVPHVMEEEHYIEWLVIDYGTSQIITHFKPLEEAKVVVDYQEGMKAYSYCNKHGLWIKENMN